MDKDYIYNNSIILIGPVGVGKSIISDALTRKLGCNQISLDDYRKVYYPKYGFFPLFDCKGTNYFLILHSE